MFVQFLVHGKLLAHKVLQTFASEKIAGLEKSKNCVMAAMCQAFILWCIEPVHTKNLFHCA
jgi:hypothetical protein